MRATGKSLLLSIVVIGASSAAHAGAHTWDVWEVFSNADGSVQFVELKEANGTNFETGIGGHPIVANPSARTYTIQHSVISPTANKSYLIATPAFAALPGAPTPDELMAPGFVLIAPGDTSVTYSPYDTATWAAGALPTDGVHSLTRTAAGSALSSAVNSPKNYAGATGSVDASPGASLPGVPDGTNGTPVTLTKLSADGSSLSVSWDTAACSGELDHQIIYGQRSGLPATVGGTYAPLGGACSIGTASPFTWNVTPDAADGNGLIWFLVVAENNAGLEGSWGKYNGANERAGPGTNGASNVCSVNDRVLSNACGH